MMPRFHFNVRDGRNVPDREGLMLPDMQAARHEAIHFAGAILQDESAKLNLHEDWYLEVTDATGLILFRITVLMSEAPAISSGSKRQRLLDNDSRRAGNEADT